MKKDGTYFKIGLFVHRRLCCADRRVFCFVSADTLGGDMILVETYVDESVQGLSVGSDVLHRGVNIGQVKQYHVCTVGISDGN